jgi:hypothetical protein
LLSKHLWINIASGNFTDRFPMASLGKGDRPECNPASKIVLRLGASISLS